jgi:hypothetical protein
MMFMFMFMYHLCALHGRTPMGFRLRPRNRKEASLLTMQSAMSDRLRVGPARSVKRPAIESQRMRCVHTVLAQMICCVYWLRVSYPLSRTNPTCLSPFSSWSSLPHRTAASPVPVTPSHNVSFHVSSFPYISRPLRVHIAQTLAHPSLPPLTRYLSMNLILSAGLVCPLTTIRV